MSIPADLPPQFKDCLSGNTCGKCSFLICPTFIEGRRKHLSARMVQACNDMVNWRQFELATIENRRQRIKLIPEAMKRLDEGTYGHCRDCRDLIAKERLEDMPETFFCAPCQQRVEAFV